MTEQAFDDRLHQIETEAARQREGVHAYRDQEMARLFNECGWTQEKIAGRMGKSQDWVSLRLRYGRFLEFTTTGRKPESLSRLTERAFRSLYAKTKGSERDRFKAVATKLSEGLPAVTVEKRHPGYAAALAEIMEDGKWYSTRQLHASMEERFPEITEEMVGNNVKNLRRQPPSGKQVEVKKSGRTCQYRLANKKHAIDLDPAAFADLCEKAEPLLDQLDEWGRAHEYQMSPAAIRVIAVKLRRLFDEALASSDKPS